MEGEYTREPCPWRITDDIGGAFAMGLGGGALWHLGVGFKNAPKGTTLRLAGAYSNMRRLAPITGGQFAAWGGMFSLCDCAMVKLRGGVEDPINSIVSGGATGALLMLRKGTGNMIVSGIVGAVLLGLIEGVSIMMTRYNAPMFDPTAQHEEAPSAAPLKPLVGASESSQPSPSSSSSYGSPLEFGSPLKMAG